MSGLTGPKPDEGLMMMQELEDRLKEHIDKLEHIRLGAAELRDGVAGANADLKQAISDHLDWLSQMSERVEMLQMNTADFVQMHTKPRAWKGKQCGRSPAPWGRSQPADDTQSEFGWSPARTRRNSDAASEMSCAW